MAVPVWPASLPQELITDGYGQQAPNTIIATQMDVGPGKRRRRTSAGVQPVQGQIVVTEAQLETLREFFRTTLGNGALRFRWVDPVSSPNPAGDARMVLDGSNGTYASTPHSEAVDITGDLTLVMKVAPDVWGLTGDTLIAKGVSYQDNAWLVRIEESGFVSFRYGYGADDQNIIRVYPAFPYTTHGVWIALSLVIDLALSSATCIFRYSYDGVNWQEHARSSEVISEPLRSTLNPVSIGSSSTGLVGPFHGNIYRAQIYSGAGFDLSSGPTSTLVADFNPADAPRSLSGGGNFTSSATGEVWTLHGNATIHNPTVGVPVEMRFTEPPQWSARTSGIYTVSLALEILP